MRPLFLATKPATLVLWTGMALVLLELTPAVGRADVVIGNLHAGDGGNVHIKKNDDVAVSFTMGNQAYSVDDVQARFRGNLSSGVTFQLESNSSGHPSGNVLTTFVNPGTTTFAVNTYTFSAALPYTLTPGTTYWLVGSTTDSSNNNWVDSDPHTDPSGIAATFGQYLESGNSGASWSSTSDEPLFQLDGTPSVGSPEPSSLVLVGTVACVSAAIGYRRRRTRHPEPAVEMLDKNETGR